MTKAFLTLGITTARGVEAALVGSGVEQAVATSDQALDGLLRSIVKVLELSRKVLADVQLIAVCTGPGSFTGLRIGTAFAKSLAQGRSLPIVGVSAYDAVEVGLADIFPRVAIIEGKRQYYYARLRRSSDSPPQFVRGGAEELRRSISEYRAGDFRAIGTCGDRLDIPQSLSRSIGGAQEIRAVCVALAGRAAFAAGAQADWRSVAIDYGQRPTAVDNWQARGG